MNSGVDEWIAALTKTEVIEKVLIKFGGGESEKLRPKYVN